MKPFFSLFILLFLLSSNSTAHINTLELIITETTIKHSGRTRESDGCHVDSSTGQEHCH